VQTYVLTTFILSTISVVLQLLSIAFTDQWRPKSVLMLINSCGFSIWAAWLLWA
jgi:hypothetical protein